jgi:hypothetical protein
MSTVYIHTHTHTHTHTHMHTHTHTHTHTPATHSASFIEVAAMLGLDDVNSLACTHTHTHPTQCPLQRFTAKENVPRDARRVRALLPLVAHRAAYKRHPKGKHRGPTIMLLPSRGVSWHVRARIVKLGQRAVCGISVLLPMLQGLGIQRSTSLL